MRYSQLPPQVSEQGTLYPSSASKVLPFLLIKIPLASTFNMPASYCGMCLPTATFCNSQANAITFGDSQIVIVLTVTNVIGALKGKLILLHIKSSSSA